MHELEGVGMSGCGVTVRVCSVGFQSIAVLMVEIGLYSLYNWGMKFGGSLSWPTKLNGSQAITGTFPL